MKHTVKIVVCVLLFALVLSLVACKQQPSTDSDAPSTETEHTGTATTPFAIETNVANGYLLGGRE